MISACLGILTILPVIWMAKRHPGLSYMQYSRSIVGTPITIVLGLPFLFFQLHMGAAIVLDIAMFLKSSMMRNTPSYWFIFLTFMVVALSVRAGIDKVTGLFPILMGNVMFFVLLITLMSYKNYDIGNLLPLMPDGPKPLLHGIYFSYGFPFGEIILFTMIFPFIPSFGSRFTFKVIQAVLFTAISLALTTVVTIMVFGPLAGERKYSLFEVARTVDIIDVFQRIEALIGYSLVVASFMKTTIVLFTAHQTCAHLLGLKEDRMLIFPIALLMACVSISALMSGDAKWSYEVSTIHPLWGFICIVVPFIVVCAVDLIRGKKQPQASSS